MSEETKKGSGCGIALAIVGGIILLLIVLAFVGGAVAFFKMSRSEEGRRVMSGMADMGKMVIESATAPGTTELRAAGCESAMITSTKKMMGTITKFVPPEKRDGASLDQIQDVLIVMCNKNLFSSDALDCAKVASVYGKAVPSAPAQFIVTVKKQGNRGDQCAGYYRADGSRVGEIDKKTMQLIPQY